MTVFSPLSVMVLSFLWLDEIIGCDCTKFRICSFICYIWHSFVSATILVVVTVKGKFCYVYSHCMKHANSLIICTKVGGARKGYKKEQTHGTHYLCNIRRGHHTTFWCAVDSAIKKKTVRQQLFARVPLQMIESKLEKCNWRRTLLLRLLCSSRHYHAHEMCTRYWMNCLLPAWKFSSSNGKTVLVRKGRIIKMKAING